MPNISIKKIAGSFPFSDDEFLFQVDEGQAKVFKADSFEVIATHDFGKRVSPIYVNGEYAIVKIRKIGKSAVLKWIYETNELHEVDVNGDYFYSRPYIDGRYSYLYSAAKKRLLKIDVKGLSLELLTEIGELCGSPKHKGDMFYTVFPDGRVCVYDKSGDLKRSTNIFNENGASTPPTELKLDFDLTESKLICQYEDGAICCVCLDELKVLWVSDISLSTKWALSSDKVISLNHGKIITFDLENGEANESEISGFPSRLSDAHLPLLKIKVIGDYLWVSPLAGGLLCVDITAVP